jgi:hypothetical protein
MTTHIILTIVLGLLSINGVNFLIAYVRLLKVGTPTNGLVVAYEASNFIMTKNATIPKLQFQTIEKQSIIGKPVHSWFIELNNYQLDKKYIAIYDNKDPNKFVIRSNIEFTINIILVTGTLVSFVWLIMLIA